MPPEPLTDRLLWSVALSLVVVLVSSWVFGGVARRLLRGRARLGLDTAMLLSILATALGLFVAGWISPNADLRSGATLVFGFGASLLAVAAYGAVAAHFQRTDRTGTAELLRMGESDQVEFKSTARINLHTGERDPRMEHVIIKTASAFMNSDGGTLLIGVDDAGTPLGLDPDFATLKAPDTDRFELWLRDALTHALGQQAAATVGVEFESLPSPEGPRLVCRTTYRPSPKPVYAAAKGDVEFWVRSGNSTRQLNVGDAAEYVMNRWPLGLGASIAAQLRAAVRFSETT